jgi:hypothetical protein
VFLSTFTIEPSQLFSQRLPHENALPTRQNYFPLSAELFSLSLLPKNGVEWSLVDICTLAGFESPFSAHPWPVLKRPMTLLVHFIQAPQGFSQALLGLKQAKAELVFWGSAAFGGGRILSVRLAGRAVV